MCLLHLDQHGVSLRLNLSMYGGALADPECNGIQNMSVWLRHNLSLERKSQTCAFLFEHRSKLTHALLQTGELYCGCLAHFLGIFVSGKGGIRLMRRKPYYLDQMDHSVRPS